jgi:hypothetical protein
MTMKRITAFAGAFALALSAATAVQAEALDLTVHRIAVVNDFDAPIAVYAEDATGVLHEVVTLKSGEVKLVDTQIDAQGTMLRLHARPTNSASRWSTWGDRGIVSDALEMSGEDTAIFWIAPDLEESSVEIRG